MKQIVLAFLIFFGFILSFTPFCYSATDQSGWIRNGAGQIIGSVPLEGLSRGLKGEFIHSEEPDGTTVMQGENERTDGKVTPPGFICPDDIPTASYEQDGMIRNRNGAVIGEVSRDGVVMRADGKIIASMPATAAGRAAGAMILVKSQNNR